MILEPSGQPVNQLCFADRPNEGSIRFNAELSPMASPAFEAGRCVCVCVCVCVRAQPHGLPCF